MLVGLTREREKELHFPALPEYRALLDVSKGRGKSYFINFLLNNSDSRLPFDTFFALRAQKTQGERGKSNSMDKIYCSLISSTNIFNYILLSRGTQ